MTLISMNQKKKKKNAIFSQRQTELNDNIN